MTTDLAGPARAWLDRVQASLVEVVPALVMEFPGVTFSTCSEPVGSLTDYQGHIVGLEATFPSEDSLALVVTVAYLTTTPRVEAGVSWTAESHGRCEATTWPGPGHSRDWPVATADNLAHVEAELPRLLAAFRAAVARYLLVGQ